MANPILELSQYRKEFLEESLKYIGISEVGTNAGPEVEKFLQAVRLGKGNPWCAAFVVFCLKEIEKKHKIDSGIYETGHALTMWNRTPENRKLKTPTPGAIVIWQMYKNGKQTTSGHAGIILENPKPNVIVTVEGNTSDSSSVSREGDGVYKKIRSFPSVSKTMVIKGFLLPF